MPRKKPQPPDARLSAAGVTEAQQAELRAALRPGGWDRLVAAVLEILKNPPAGAAPTAGPPT